MLKLGVNIDHVATLRQARYARDPGNFNREPDIVAAAQAAVAGGGDSITVHARADGRHMQVADVWRLKEVLEVPLNLEMGATRAMWELALSLRPAYVCVVPETREEVTTEGGLDVPGNRAVLGEMIPSLQAAGIQVSLFIDPEPAQVAASIEAKADMVELHTGCFANASGPERDHEVRRLRQAAGLASAGGLLVNAGHGINFQNLAGLFPVSGLNEWNIGHSLVARAVFVGLEQAVREMRAAMNAYPG